LSGKTIVITGGTAGIGLAAAQALARRGHRLLLIGRDPTRGEEAVASLPRHAGRAHRFIAADLSLMANVRTVVAELDATEPAIDVLANNAGTWFRHRELTSEGIERTVAINHLAYVAMTLGLKHLLLAARDARVINTGSFVWRYARYDPDNMQAERSFSTNRTYAASKLYNLMATRALAARCAGEGITVSCFSPGFVATGFGRDQGGWLEPYYRFIRLFAMSPQRGAATLVDLAHLPTESGVNGAYFEKGRLRAVGGDAADADRCEELLKWSVHTAGIDVEGGLPEPLKTNDHKRI
jgi:NAD(P)-dependent dehydrogenase (short-subunit alcohol dehydrogenase family)